jgi:hypothetical protein
MGLNPPRPQQKHAGGLANPPRPAKLPTHPAPSRLCGRQQVMVREATQAVGACSQRSTGGPASSAPSRARAAGALVCRKATGVEKRRWSRGVPPRHKAAVPPDGPAPPPSLTGSRSPWPHRAPQAQNRWCEGKTAAAGLPAPCARP